MQPMLPLQPVVTLEPTYHLPFDETPNVFSLVFVPDRGVVLVHMHAPALNLWRLGVSIWPELLGIGGGLLLLIALYALRRVLRRPRVRGEPYCRRCNYHLVHLADDAKCPECGRIVAKTRVLGRRRWHRLAIPSLLCMVSLTMLATPVLVALPRYPALGERYYIGAPAVLAWAEKNKIDWIVDRKTAGDRVVEVDLETGRIVRTVYAQATSTFSRLGVNCDATLMFLHGPGNEVRAVSTSSGRCVARMTSPDLTALAGPDLEMNEGVVLPSADPQVVYVPGIHQGANESRLLRWRLGDEPRIVARSHLYDRSRCGRGFLVRKSGDETTFVTYPDFTEAYHQPTRLIEVVDQAGEQLTTVELEQHEFDTDPQVAMHPDGRRLFVATRYGESLLIIDLESGETEACPWSRSAILAARPGFPFFRSDTIAIHEERSLLFAFGHRAAVAMDVETGQARAHFSCPSHLFAPHLFTSKRWLGTVMLSQQQKNGSYAHEVVLWDLSPLLDDEL